MVQEIEYKARVVIVNHNSNDLVTLQEYNSITKDELQNLFNCITPREKQVPLPDKRTTIKGPKGEILMSYINYSGISKLGHALVNIIAWGVVAKEVDADTEDEVLPYEIVVNEKTNCHIANFKYYEGLRYIENTDIKHSFEGEINTYYISCGDVCVTVEPSAFPNVKRRFI